jgi:alpha-mannosidase
VKLPEGWRNEGTVSILEEKMEAGDGLLPFEVKSWRLSRLS